MTNLTIENKSLITFYFRGVKNGEPHDAGFKYSVIRPHACDAKFDEAELLQLRDGIQKDLQGKSDGVGITIQAISFEEFCANGWDDQPAEVEEAAKLQMLAMDQSTEKCLARWNHEQAVVKAASSLVDLISLQDQPDIVQSAVNLIHAVNSMRQG